MSLKERINKINNFKYKTVFMLVFSLAINFGFIGYNAYLGFRFSDAFAIGISVYYFVLFWVKLATLIVENSVANKDDDIKYKKRVTNYKISSIFVFFIDFCLIAPIILMVVRPKDVKFGLIPAIAMATYCVYKIVMAIINYRLAKKSNNPTTVLLKEIDIIGAIVSVLNLQHTLIMVNGGMTKSMQTLSLITSIGFIVLIIVFSILSFIKNKNYFKNSL